MEANSIESPCIGSEHKSSNLPEDFSTETNTGGQAIRKWCQAYLNSDSYDVTFGQTLDVLHEDKLDHSSIENEIQTLMPHVDIQQRYCPKCRQTFNNWPIYDARRMLQLELESEDGLDAVLKFSHIRNYQETTIALEAAARRGCQFCALNLQYLVDSELLTTFRKIEGRLKKAGLGTEPHIWLYIRNWGNFEEHVKCQSVWLSYPGQRHEDINRVRHGLQSFHVTPESWHIRNPTLLIDDPILLAKDWLQLCLAEHKSCWPKSDLDLPTRLLCIAKDPVRLVITTEWKVKPQYATLSHCWGNNVFLRLVSTNLETLKSRIETNQLSKTFQDAIGIARGLDIDFIWIDSLCIVQDDFTDWERESALMASVYGGSTINIAASSAIDGSMGCFVKPPHFCGGCTANLNIAGSERAFSFTNYYTYDLAVTDSHLASRAWALQEKVLAPRTLHCGDRGLFWECKSLTASEFLPNGFTGHDDRLMNTHLSVYENWGKIIRMYSACNATFSKDKLVALSGIARKAKESTDDQYLAGMWRNTLEVQMSWTCEDPQLTRPPYRAPSWSWASIDGQVTGYYPFTQCAGEDTYAHVLDAIVIPSTENRFGQISSGCLKMCSSAMAAGRIPEPLPSFDGAPHSKITCELAIDDKIRQFPVSLDVIREQHDIRSGRLFLLPITGGHIGQGRFRRGLPRLDYYCIRGILLQATNQVQGQYRRVGAFSFDLDDEHDDYQPFLDVLAESGEATAEEACAEIVTNDKYEKERFVITII